MAKVSIKTDTIDLVVYTEDLDKLDAAEYTPEEWDIICALRDDDQFSDDCIREALDNIIEYGWDYELAPKDERLYRDAILIYEDNLVGRITHDVYYKDGSIYDCTYDNEIENPETLFSYLALAHRDELRRAKARIETLESKLHAKEMEVSKLNDQILTAQAVLYSSKK